MPPVRKVVQTLAAPDEPVDERVDAVELRLDLYPGLDPAAWIARSRKPVVVAVRRAADGGRWDGDEEARGVLLRHARGAAWADVELDADPAFVPAGAKRLVSVHDPRGVPPDLGALYARCVAAGGARVKLAVTPSSSAEALGLLDLPEPAIGMGEYGTVTRVLAHWTYCAREPVAPGILSPEDLFDLYAIRRLSARPALFGVAGDPVAHSRSPHLHNAGFRSAGLDAVYLPFRVADLEEFWPAFVARGGVGLSVTSPLKVRAAALATRPAPEVRSCGAANTLLSDGRAYNTDYRAFLELLPRPAGRTLVMGAGGSARAAVAALRTLGAPFRVWARRPEAAAALGADVAPRPEPAEIVINTTPVPPPPASFHVELRYGGGVAVAADRGVDGLRFLEAQGRHQLELFRSVLGGGD